MRYFIIVVSKEHVDKGVKDGVAQAGHGKKTQLEKLSKGDWVIYYSSKEKINDKKPYQKFTAIGQVKDDAPFQVELTPNFKPWRRKVKFAEAVEQEIHPLLDRLGFITNRNRWGLHLMSGFLEIQKSDFEMIEKGMINVRN